MDRQKTSSSGLLKRIGAIGAASVVAAMLPSYQAKADDTFNVNLAADSGIGGSAFYAGHTDGASEEFDGFDSTYPPFNPYSQWLRLSTNPYGSALAVDERPLSISNSPYSVFRGDLTASDSTGSGINADNVSLTLNILEADPNVKYNFTFNLYGQYAKDGNPFSTTINDVQDKTVINIPGINTAARYILQDTHNTSGTSYTKIGDFTITPYNPNIPEPSSAGLVLAGIAAAGALIRKSKKQGQNIK